MIANCKKFINQSNLVAIKNYIKKSGDPSKFQLEKLVKYSDGHPKIQKYFEQKLKEQEPQKLKKLEPQKLKKPEPQKLKKPEPQQHKKYNVEDDDDTSETTKKISLNENKMKKKIKELELKNAKIINELLEMKKHAKSGSKSVILTIAGTSSDSDSDGEYYVKIPRKKKTHAKKILISNAEIVHSEDDYSSDDNEI